MSGWDQQGDIEDLNQRIHKRGLWGLHCFNGWDKEQQEFLVNEGYLPIFTAPKGECLNGAEVGLETDRDTHPGPRFYCRRCAIDFLSWQETQEVKG